MPYARPTLTELARQALADLAAATGAYAVLRTSPVAALGKACAGLVHGVYGYVDWIARQAVPATATDEYLEAWAGLVGITRKPATAATGSVALTGVPGTVIPAGTPVVRSADGVAYSTIAETTIGGGGTATVAIQADEAGPAGNAASGAAFVLGTAIPGVNSAGTAVGAVTGGVAQEADEDLRARMLERYAAPPQGGAPADYVGWAKEVPGVTRAWVAPNGFGAGTVVVYVMLDDANAAFGGFPQGTDGVATAEPRGTPATGDQLAVADHIYPLRPATALVHVVAPTAYPVDVTITDLSANTADIRVGIEAALREAFRRHAEPGGKVYTSDLAAAIDAVDGVARFTLTAPAASVQPGAGQIATLGTLTFV